jgi:hypothetical protein
MDGTPHTGAQQYKTGRMSSHVVSVSLQVSLQAAYDDVGMLLNE